MVILTANRLVPVGWVSCIFLVQTALRRFAAGEMDMIGLLLHGGTISSEGDLSNQIIKLFKALQT